MRNQYIKEMYSVFEILVLNILSSSYYLVLLFSEIGTQVFDQLNYNIFAMIFDVFYPDPDIIMFCIIKFPPKVAHVKRD